ncbi:MAG: PilZ domain-containing protein [Alsobacter sp.]
MIPRLSRQKVLKEAKIMIGETKITCLIENLSETGAALILAEHFSPASSFVLSTQGFPERKCEVVWHRARLVGVKFV